MTDKNNLFSLEIHTKDSNCEVHNQSFKNICRIFLGKEHWAGCPICAAEAKAIRVAEDERKIAVDKQAKLSSMMMESGIPRRYMDATFDNFNAHTDELALNVETLKKFGRKMINDPKFDGMLILSGNRGTGKNHLANSLANSLLGKKTVFSTNMHKLISMVRDTWHPSSKRTTSQVYASLSQVDLLIVDEFGLNKCTEDENNILFNIVHARYEDLKPTILITNLTFESSCAALGPRLFDRFRECGDFVPFTGDSYRSSLKKNHYG